MSLIALAGARVTDVRQYLKEVSADKSIKYTSEKGAKHHLYYPVVATQIAHEDGSVTTEYKPMIMTTKVHDWNDGNGGYNSCICLDGLIREDKTTGRLLNDGTCPICNRVKDAWDIYHMREEELENTCQLPAGKPREDFIKKTLEGYRDDLKAKACKDFAYVLLAQFETEKGNPVIDEDTKLPKYALRVAKYSASRLTKIEQQLSNSGAELGGSEIIIEYKNVDDVRQQVGESTIALVMDNQKFVNMYPGLLEAINKEAETFNFNTIDKAFKEWQGMTTEEATIKMKAQFKRWDEYQEALKVNPNAVYLEYSQAATNVGFNNMAAPQVGAVGQIGQMGGQMPPVGVPMGGQVPQMGVPQMGVPQMAPQMGVPQMPQNPVPQADVQTPQMGVPQMAPQAAPMNPMGGFPQGTPVGQVGQPEQMGVPQMQSAPVADSAVAGMGSIPDPNAAFSATNMTI